MNYKQYLQEKLDINIINNELVEQALIHPSYANEINNNSYHYERLEFIGDAILQFLASEYLFLKFQDINEGKLTILRSKLVREESLAMFASKYEMYNYIRVGKGEEKSGGTHKQSVLANVFESMIGAIYLSNGLNDVKKFLAILFKAIDDNQNFGLEDYKTKLQEYVQADNKRTVVYELIDTKGSANNPLFTFNVKIDDLVLGLGSGHSKKQAQQAAAKNALEKLAKK